MMILTPTRFATIKKSTQCMAQKIDLHAYPVIYHKYVEHHQQPSPITVKIIQVLKKNSAQEKGKQNIV